MHILPMSRRSFLGKGTVAAAALGTRGLVALMTPARTIAETSAGSLSGETANGVRIFRGVLFAQPPVGALRFRPPNPLKRWTGTRDATQFAPAALQPGEPKLKQSEDCLYLNIWAPDDHQSHPVFVWIHGGGFTGGHAFAPIFDGTEFAAEGIVVVTVAYRLGVLGFVDVRELLGPEYTGSANNALRDVIAALRWVQENIAAFGGDPGRVTVGGESAGAKLTDILMGTPQAAPLFHQMISESGGAERVWSAETSRVIAKGFGNLWEKERAEKAAGMKVDPGPALIEVQKKFTATWPQHFPLRCEVDGTLLPRKPIETIATGSTRGKRLLIGTNRDESTLFVGPNPKIDPSAGDLGNMTPATFRDVFARYRQVYPDMSDEQRRIRALTAEEYWIPSIRVADAHVAAGGSAWMYRLDFAPTSGRFAGEAYHSLDLGLVWNKPNEEIANREEEVALAKKMHVAWIAFIQGKLPAADGLPAWPQYSSSDRATMVLNTNSQIELKPQEAELNLWKDVL